MTTEVAFLAAIKDDPEDELHRLVFADWLEEKGQTARARFVPMQLERARLLEGAWPDDWRLDPDNPEWAEGKLREETLLRQHGRAWRGAPPRGPEVTFWRGTLSVKARCASLTTPGVRAWWQQQQPRIESFTPTYYAERTSDPTHRLGHLIDTGYLTEVARLNMGYTEPGRETFAALGRMPSLRHLDLTACYGGTSALRHLAGNTRIQILILAESGFGDGGLSLLASLPGLRKLDLTDSPLGEGDASCLKDLSRLEELSVIQWGLPGPPAASLRGLKHLHKLAVGLTGWKNEDLRHLTALTHLRTLSLAIDVSPFGRGFRHLHALPHLERLRIEGGPINEVAIRELSRLGPLRELALVDIGHRDKQLVALAGLTGLRRLTLSGAEVRGSVLKPLAGLPELEDLNLTHANLTDASLRHLPHFPRLRSLDISLGPVKGEGLKHLARVSGLRQLRAEAADFTGRDLKLLVELPHLEVLDLPNSGVTDAGIPYLIRMPSLRFVNLRGSKVSRAGYKRLKQARRDLLVEGPA